MKHVIIKKKSYIISSPASVRMYMLLNIGNTTVRSVHPFPKMFENSGVTTGTVTQHSLGKSSLLRHWRIADDVS